MKLTHALALATTALALYVPAAGAAPDGYQPQLNSSPDAFMRYLANNPGPQAGAATHPDSRGVRFSPTGLSVTPQAGGDGRDVTTGVIGILLGAFGTVLAIGSASAIRGRRRLAGAS